MNGERRPLDRRADGQVPAFQPGKVNVVAPVVKAVAKPLSAARPAPHTSTAGSSGSFVDTVVQRPGDRNSVAEEAKPTSVKDRVKNIEVFTHSPSPSRASHAHVQAGGPASNPEIPDSLEQLESSAIQSDNVRDRLRPVVKKPESVTASDSVPVPGQRVDAADSMSSTPPVVPTRTYKQQSSAAPYRRDSFQRNGPKPYESKANTSANTHNPLHQNAITNSPQGPEPQVPSRLYKPSVQHTARDHHNRDQITHMSSPDSRGMQTHSDENVQNIENNFVNSVQLGQKRNYERSFSPRTRSDSSGSLNHQSVASSRSPSDSQKAKETSEPRQRLDNARLAGSQTRADLVTVTRVPSWRQTQPSTDNHVTHNADSPHPAPHEPDSRQEEQKPAPAHLELRESQPVVHHKREPSTEELECDQRAKELALVLRDSDRELSAVLTSDTKNRMQFLDGILPVDDQTELRQRSSSKKEDTSHTQETKDEYVFSSVIHLLKMQCW